MKLRLKQGAYAQAPYKHGITYEANGLVTGLVEIKLPNGKIVYEPNTVVPKHFTITE